MVYATVDDFETYLGSSAPADIGRLLQRASELVDTFVLAPYSVEADSSITETYVREALRDATCAQVEFWMSTGDEVEATAYFDSPGIGSLNLKRSGVRLAPRAEDSLTRAGLRQVVS